MKKPSIADLIYERTFPKPKQNDPASFYAHVHRHIVGEVRAEVQTYYGTVDNLEAQYPGLDYTNPAHRRRMCRYAWHRRLFRVFDELKLTNDEILGLCRWEGTRAAKERYEQEAMTQVKSTTAAEVVAAPVGSGPRAIFEQWLPSSDSTQGEAEKVAMAVLNAEAATAETAPGKVRQRGRAGVSPQRSGEMYECFRDIMLSQLQGETFATSQVLEQWLQEAYERHDANLESVMRAVSELAAAAGAGVAGANASRMDDGSGPVQVDPALPSPELAPSASRTLFATSVQTSDAYEGIPANTIGDLPPSSTPLLGEVSSNSIHVERSRPELAR
ncbi:hypothetical protein ABEF93_007740 [Exophiala dermatitidis]